MKEILTTGLRIIGWITLLFAFASIGFMTDNPAMMVPLYFVFFILVFAGVYFYNQYRFKNAQHIVSVRRKKELKKSMMASAKSTLINKIFGLVLTVIAISIPWLMFRDVGFTFIIQLLMTIVTIALIVLAVIAITLVNKKIFPHNVLGYLLLVIISSVPAFMMMQYDRSYHALGTAYYISLIVAVLAWYGSVITIKHFKKA